MKSKIENFWYYHKTIIIIVAIILAAFAFVTLTNKTPDYDYQFGIISPDYYSDESVNALTKALEPKYGNVKINVYTVELGAEGQDPATIGAIDADLVGKVSTSFLLKNVASFKDATNNLKTTDPVSVSDINELQGLGFDDLYLVTRIYD